MKRRKHRLLIQFGEQEAFLAVDSGSQDQMRTSHKGHNIWKTREIPPNSNEATAMRVCIIKLEQVNNSWYVKGCFFPLRSGSKIPVKMQLEK